MSIDKIDILIDKLNEPPTLVTSATAVVPLLENDPILQGLAILAARIRAGESAERARVATATQEAKAKVEKNVEKAAELTLRA